MDTVKLIQTESGLDEFQVRLIRDDGVGLLTDRENNSYLILDSLDYWYDLIQEQYPTKTKCSCKNDWFKVSFRYEYRENSSDIRNVLVSTVCTNCGRNTKRMPVDINYGPTDELSEKPISYCEKPLIKYKYNELTGIWASDDLNRVLHFLLEEQDLTAYYHYFKYPDKVRMFHTLTLEQALKRGSQFLGVYFTRGAIENAVTFEDEMGVMVDKSIWRKREIVHVFNINMYDLPLYYIQYCNQYIDHGEVKDKSVEFEEMTNRLESWLSKTFVKSRGRNCYDGEEGYQMFKMSRKWYTHS